jgi:UDP-2,3-diacylglucosamine pyrophosphatase LpxH
MSILIVGDIHIGDSKSAHRDFYEFLRRSENDDVDRLIINGDLFDLWVSSIDTVLLEGAYLLKYIHDRFGDKFVYILGNHDKCFDPLRIISDIMVDRLVININGKRILITHGHQFEETTKFMPKTIPWIINKLERIFKLDMRKYLMSLSDVIRKDPFGYFLDSFHDEMLKWCNNHYHFIIINHTHKPMVKKLDNGVICINTGDWVQHRSAVKITDIDIILTEYDTVNIGVTSFYPIRLPDAHS